VTDQTQLSSNQCDVCGKPAVQWLADPWGKSDVLRPKCVEHGMRLRDSEDIAEIERLRGRLDLISRLSPLQPVILAVQLAKEALSGLPDETDERPIREDVKVGSTLFRAGVKLRIVLERIERGFTYHAEPSDEAPAATKRAYYETHEPPHCPTCDCGVPAGVCDCKDVLVVNGRCTQCRRPIRVPEKAGETTATPEVRGLYRENGRLRKVLRHVLDSVPLTLKEPCPTCNEAERLANGSDAEATERFCACIPMAPRSWKYCQDCGGRIPENGSDSP